MAAKKQPNKFAGLSMTANAPVAATAQPKTGKKREVLTILGTKLAAALCEVVNSLKSQMEREKGKVKDAGKAHFLDQLRATGQKPETITANEDDASATIVMSSSSSVTDPIILAAMEQHNVSYEMVGVPEHYFVNPELTVADLKKIDAAVSKLQLSGPFLMLQPASERVQVTDQTWRDLAAVKNPDIQERIFNALAQPSFKSSSFDESDDALQHAVDWLIAQGLMVAPSKGKKGKAKT